MKQKFLKQNLIWIILTVGIIFGITIFYWFKSDERIDTTILNLNFSGKVTEIRYDIKQFPWVTINGHDYYIGAGYDTDHKIEVGDSLVKEKGSFKYRLIKRNGSKVIDFDR
ncbi:hypothetical protein [Mucilaginibacter sp. 3215]|uniref:hypothetical protein n=1 Tax=Mucilaginibacter sp. 3215 TaxID=3373912 RepID=UPI003D216C13